MPSHAPVCAWVAACALVLPSAALAQVLSAQDVVDVIVREGPRAVAIRAEVDVVQRQQSARRPWPNPGLVYSREGAGFTEFVQVEQALPLFGIRAALSRAGVAATAAAEAERDARLWELRAEASRLVAGLTADQARLDTATTTAESVERLLDVLRVREREGEGSRFDRLRAEQELEDLEHAAVTASVRVVETRGLLAAMLPPGTALTRVAGVLFEARPALDRETLTARARGDRAELRALQLAAERADRESDVAKKARLPQPIVTGGLKRADAEGTRENGGVLGVSVTVPLFDAGGRDVARWAAERARATAERAALEHTIRVEIARAAEALDLRQGALASADRAAADELVTTAEVAYREGEVGILALLDAVRTAARARQRDIEMRLEARLAQVALERAVGGVLWP